MGLNEFAGYLAVAGSALATGYIAARYGLRPEPFYLGSGLRRRRARSCRVFAFARRRGTCQHEAAARRASREARAVSSARSSCGRPSPTATSRPSARPAWSTTSTTAWPGALPALLRQRRSRRSSRSRRSRPSTRPSGAWASSFTGALSDRLGRKWLIACGMWVQAAGIAIVVLWPQMPGFVAGSILLGIGTAMVYPTLLAAIGDVAAALAGAPRRSASTGSGATSATRPVRSCPASPRTCSACRPPSGWSPRLTFASGLVVAFRMRETRAERDSHCPGLRDLHRQSCVLPLGKARLQSTGLATFSFQDCHGLVGEHAVRARGSRRPPPGPWAARAAAPRARRAGSKARRRCGRQRIPRWAHIDQDDRTCLQPRLELVEVDGIHVCAVAEVRTGPGDPPPPAAPPPFAAATRASSGLNRRLPGSGRTSPPSAPPPDGPRAAPAGGPRRCPL